MNDATDTPGKHLSGLALEIEGHVAVLTLAHPPANTWTRDSLVSLLGLLRDLDERPGIRALVITGAGDRFFCAGDDLRMFADGDKAAASDVARCLGEALEALSMFHGVSIAAINGYAMGGGLECALACDLRIAEAHATLGLPEARVGLLPCGGGTQLLPRLVGEGWAKRMILLGEPVDAATAQRIGLVEEVVPAGQARTRALAWARQAVRQSPASVAACKRLVQATRAQTLEAALVDEREAFVDLFDGPDPREGVGAFLEKREPRWRDA